MLKTQNQQNTLFKRQIVQALNWLGKTTRYEHNNVIYDDKTYYNHSYTGLAKISNKTKSLYSKAFKYFKDIKLINSTFVENRRNYVNWNYSNVMGYIKENKSLLQKYGFGCTKRQIKNITIRLKGGKIVLFYNDIERKYGKEAYLIVKNMVETLVDEKGKRVFNHRINAYEEETTKTINNACCFVQCLYDGTYMNDSMFVFNDNFYQNSQFPIDIDYVKLTLRDIKGNWDDIRDVIKEAKERFMLMHKAEYLPISKNHLTKSIDTWFYDRENLQSQFIQCLFPIRKKGEYFRDKRVEKAKDNHKYIIQEGITLTYDKLKIINYINNLGDLMRKYDRNYKLHAVESSEKTDKLSLMYIRWIKNDSFYKTFLNYNIFFSRKGLNAFMKFMNYMIEYYGLDTYYMEGDCKEEIMYAFNGYLEEPDTIKEKCISAEPDKIRDEKRQRNADKDYDINIIIRKVYEATGKEITYKQAEVLYMQEKEEKDDDEDEKPVKKSKPKTEIKENKELKPKKPVIELMRDFSEFGNDYDAICDYLIDNRSEIPEGWYDGWILCRTMYLVEAMVKSIRKDNKKQINKYIQQGMIEELKKYRKDYSCSFKYKM